MAPLLPFLLLLATPWPVTALPARNSGQDELIRLHEQLVRTVSITRSEHADTQNDETDERNVVREIETWFRRTSEQTGIRLTVERQEVTAGRDNLYIYAGDRTMRNTHVLLTSHVDTVPPYIGYSVDGDKIKGRGTNDAKGCVAAMMIAFRDLLVSGRASPDGGDVSVLFVVGEEIGGQGMKRFDELGMSWDAAIFGEPTESKLAVSQVGGLVVKVEAHGKAAHSGMPEQGVDAIAILRKAMNALDDVLADLPSADLGTNSLTIGRIGGGQADNAVPAHAWASGSYRVFVDPAEAMHRIPQTIWKVACPSEAFGGDVQPCSRITVAFPHKEAPEQLAHDVQGFDTFAARFGSDLGLLSGPRKKYLYGPGSITTAHKDEEFVSMKELIASVDGYKAITVHCLKEAKAASRQ